METAETVLKSSTFTALKAENLEKCNFLKKKRRILNKNGE